MATETETVHRTIPREELKCLLIDPELHKALKSEAARQGQYLREMTEAHLWKLIPASTAVTTTTKV